MLMRWKSTVYAGRRKWNASLGPCWDVGGVINLEQFLRLDEHLAAIMSVICQHGPFLYARTGDVTLND
jgi:hypothetical protein